MVQEEFYGKELVIADRELVETGSDDILAGADTGDVALLVVGDPLGWVLNNAPCILVHTPDSAI